MQKGGVASDRVRYTTIATKNDELVMPYTSGHLEGKHVTNFVIQDVSARASAGLSPDQSEHLSIIFDPNAAQDILNALGRGRNAPIPCVRSCRASAPRLQRQPARPARPRASAERRSAR